MDVEAFFEEMPFASLLGIELTECADGHAAGRLELDRDLSWSAERDVAHGGAVFALADTVGGAALVSLVDRPVPTVDMRIDYLAAATDDLTATAEVVSNGSSVGTVDVSVRSADREEPVAVGRGVYKTGE